MDVTLEIERIPVFEAARQAENDLIFFAVSDHRTGEFDVLLDPWSRRLVRFGSSCHLLPHHDCVAHEIRLWTANMSDSPTVFWVTKHRSGDHKCSFTVTRSTFAEPHQVIGFHADDIEDHAAALHRADLLLLEGYVLFLPTNGYFTHHRHFEVPLEVRVYRQDTLELLRRVSRPANCECLAASPFGLVEKVIRSHQLRWVGLPSLLHVQEMEETSFSFQHALGAVTDALDRSKWPMVMSSLKVVLHSTAYDGRHYWFAALLENRSLSLWRLPPETNADLVSAFWSTSCPAYRTWPGWPHHPGAEASTGILCLLPEQNKLVTMIDDGQFILVTLADFESEVVAVRELQPWGESQRISRMRFHPVNRDLSAVCRSPHGHGWLFKIELSSTRVLQVTPDDLLGPGHYIVRLLSGEEAAKISLPAEEREIDSCAQELLAKIQPTPTTRFAFVGPGGDNFSVARDLIAHLYATSKGRS